MKKKVITFICRTWQQIRVAYEALRTRYKKPVRMTTIPLGAGLFQGVFEIG